MALKDLGEKGIVDPYPPLVDIKGKPRTVPIEALIVRITQCHINILMS